MIAPDKLHGLRYTPLLLIFFFISAIAEGRRPAKMAADEAAIYDFIDELSRNRSVSDPTYARAKEHFGERGVIDMIGIHGYYSLLAMILNVSRAPLPEGSKTDL